MFMSHLFYTKFIFLMQSERCCVHVLWVEKEDSSLPWFHDFSLWNFFFFFFSFLFSLRRPLTFPHKNIPPMKRMLAWSNLIRKVCYFKMCNVTEAAVHMMHGGGVKCSFARLTQQLFLHFMQKKRRNIADIFFSLFEQTHVVATFIFKHKRERTMRMGGKHLVREVLAT